MGPSHRNADSIVSQWAVALTRSSVVSDRGGSLLNFYARGFLRNCTDNVVESETQRQIKCKNYRAPGFNVEIASCRCNYHLIEPVVFWSLWQVTLGPNRAERSRPVAARLLITSSKCLYLFAACYARNNYAIWGLSNGTEKCRRRFFGGRFSGRPPAVDTSRIATNSFWGTKTARRYKDVPKLTQDLNLIENTVFSLDYVIFLLNYKVHRIGLFVE